MRRWIAAVLLLALCLSVGTGEAAELRGWDKKEKYQYVQLGTYPYEADGTTAPVVWRVLEVKGGKALLLSEYVIDTQQVIFTQDKKVSEKHTFRKVKSYEETDLCAWMNSTMLDTLLGGDPMLGAVTEEKFGRLYCLDDDSYLRTDYGFSAARYGNMVASRLAKGTPYAKAVKVTPWGKKLYEDSGTHCVTYWVAEIKNPRDVKMAIVGYNGHISYGVYSRTNIGVRPALTLDLSLCKIRGGKGTLENPYKLTYTGDTASSNAVGAGRQEKKVSTISLIGDVSIGDSTQSRGANSLTATVQNKGYDWLFSSVTDYTLTDDCTLANLEVVLTTRANLKSKNLYNLIAPPEHAQILVKGGVDVVNTVNNHSFDFKKTGYDDTLAALDKAGVAHFGSIYVGSKNRESDIYTTYDAGGVKIGLVGFSYPQNADLKRIETRIQKLREQGAEIVIVSLHWGRENHIDPTSGQFSYAKKVLGYGADVIWGHHPHIVQPVYFFDGKPVLFSTGNFIFGTISDMNPSTGVFQLDYERQSNGSVRLKCLRVIPYKTTRKAGEYRPELQTDPDKAAAVLKRLMTRRKMNGFTSLPDGFEKTGTVYVLSDGSLSLKEKN